MNETAWTALREYEDSVEQEKEYQELKAKAQIARARERSAQLQGLSCKICGGTIHVEVWNTWQAKPSYCHKVSCKTEGKRRNNANSRAKKNV